MPQSVARGVVRCSVDITNKVPPGLSISTSVTDLHPRTNPNYLVTLFWSFLPTYRLPDMTNLVTVIWSLPLKFPPLEPDSDRVTGIIGWESATCNPRFQVATKAVTFGTFPLEGETDEPRLWGQLLGDKEIHGPSSSGSRGSCSR